MRDRSSVEGFLQTIDANEGQSLLETPLPASKGNQKPIIFAFAIMWIGVIVTFIYIGMLGTNTSNTPHNLWANTNTREFFMGAYVNDSARFQGERVHIFASGCSKTSMIHFHKPGGQYYGSKPASLTSFCTNFEPCSASKGCDWPLSAYLDLPANATPGVWSARYDIHGRNNSDHGTERSVSFAVLANSPTSSTVHVIPVYTYAAYNFYGGMSFYLNPNINGKTTHENEEEFLNALKPTDELYYTKRTNQTVLSLNRPYIYQDVYPNEGEIGKASHINWQMTWSSFTGMVIPESHLLSHRDWLCKHFTTISIEAKNEYVDVHEISSLLECSSNVTLNINSFEYAFHHVNHTDKSTLLFTWDTWNEGGWRLDRDVFGGSNLFTGYKQVLFCLQHEFGNCMSVRNMEPVEGLPDYTIPTGSNQMIVYPNQYAKFGFAPKNSVLRYSFNRTSADAVWKFVGAEFDKDTHKMTNPPVVASFMINTHNGAVEIGAACPGNVCDQGLECSCVGYSPAQSFFDGRPSNKANWWYWA